MGTDLIYTARLELLEVTATGTGMATIGDTGYSTTTVTSTEATKKDSFHTVTYHTEVTGVGTEVTGVGTEDMDALMETTVVALADMAVRGTNRLVMGTMDNLDIIKTLLR